MAVSKKSVADCISLAPLLAALLALVGCHSSASRPAEVDSSQVEPAEADSADGVSGQGADDIAVNGTEAPRFAEPPEDDLDGGKLLEESWTSKSIQGLRIGYARTLLATVNEQGRELIRFSYFGREFAGLRMSEEVSHVFWETPEGDLVRFSARLSTFGPYGDIRHLTTTGEVVAGQLEIDIINVNDRERRSIPWERGWGGIAASYRSFLRQPLGPGETRTITGYQLKEEGREAVRYEALDYETVELPKGPARLLRVSSALKGEQGNVATTLWFDKRGDAMKLFVPSTLAEATATTKADALRRSGRGLFDRFHEQAFALKGYAPLPPDLKQAVYRARLKSGTIKGLFRESPSQVVKLLDDKTAEITVRAIRSGGALPAGVQSTKPTKEDSASGAFIDSADEKLAALARRLTNSDDPSKVASALAKFVDAPFGTGRFSLPLMTASQSLNEKVRDCGDHAVLFAALCRARKIPARVVLGLVHDSEKKGMIYDLWNEVWIHDRWVPFDAAVRRDASAADRIQLTLLDFSTPRPLSDLLPAPLFQRLELELVNTR